jgi:hypothetical protein
MLLTLGAAGCQYDPIATVDDAGSEVGSACVHALPPPRPVTAPSDGGSDLVFAVRQVDTGDTDDATGTRRFLQMGFDLDNACTANGAGFTCREPSWATADHTDGPGGRDNAIGESLYNATAAGGTSATQKASSDAESGRLSMVIRVRGYNGAADDDAIEVTYYVGPFHPEPGRPRPLWDGQDTWDANYQWLQPATLPDGGATYDITRPKYVDSQAYVAGNYIVSHMETLLDGAGGFHLLKAVIALRLTPGHTRLADGTFAGRVRIDEVLGNLAQFPAPGTTQPLCRDSPYYPALKAVACSFADISATGPDDGLSVCDAASWAWRIVDAEPARLGSVSLEVPTQPCPDALSPANDHCDAPM